MVSAGCISGMLTWRRARPGERTNIKKIKNGSSLNQESVACQRCFSRKQRKREGKEEKSGNISQRDSNSLSPGVSSFVWLFAKPIVVLAPANLGLGDAGAPGVTHHHQIEDVPQFRPQLLDLLGQGH